MKVVDLLMPVLEQTLAFLRQIVSTEETCSAASSHGPGNPVAQFQDPPGVVLDFLPRWQRRNSTQNLVPQYSGAWCGTVAFKRMQVASTQCAADHFYQDFAGAQLRKGMLSQAQRFEGSVELYRE